MRGDAKFSQGGSIKIDTALLEIKWLPFASFKQQIHSLRHDIYVEEQGLIMMVFIFVVVRKSN
ncbi:MAG: hypothetical protein ACI8WB_004162 [Phenylobacterium sp.]|jgi:hypothetical protein